MKSLGHALHGLADMVRTQRNAKVHLAMTLVVLALAAMLQVKRVEWMVLCFAVGLVWAAEALNTAMETLADALHPRRNPKVGLAKDLAAAGVLCAALAAMAVGATVFYPYVVKP